MPRIVQLGDVKNEGDLYLRELGIDPSKIPSNIDKTKVYDNLQLMIQGKGQFIDKGGAGGGWHVVSPKKYLALVKRVLSGNYSTADINSLENPQKDSRLTVKAGNKLPPDNEKISAAQIKSLTGTANPQMNEEGRLVSNNSSNNKNMALEVTAQVEGINLNRKLTAEDLQMINLVGRPLSDLELNQLKQNIPFDRILQAAQKSFSRLERAEARNELDTQEAARLKEMRGYKKAEGTIGQIIAELKPIETKQAAFDVEKQEQFVSPVNTSIADAVRNELAAGSTPDRIRRSLLTAGYSAANIESALGGQPFIPSTGVPGDQGQMGKFRSDVITDPQAPNIQFSTGNPQLDDFLNNTWFPLMQAQFSDDPISILNDDIFKKVEERINATYGPIFQNELNLIEGGFGRSFRELEAQQAQGIQEAETGRARTLEDVGVQKERIARSYTEALEDSRAALASRGLAFGGTREKVEAGLEQQRQTQVGDVERAGQRTLEDITTQAQNLGLQTPLEQQLATGQFAGNLGRRLEDIAAGRTQSQAELAGERVLQIEAEKNRLRTLGGQLMQNPQFFPIT